MIDIRPILQVAGILLATLAIAMFLPMVADLIEGNDDWQVFLGAGFLTLFVGMSLFLTNRTGVTELTVRQAFLLTTIAWVVLCAFAALPFAFADLGLDYVDALFEATAGLTTTGATVVAELNTRPAGILLWRALLQWMGGIGIIVTAVAVLPMLRIAGMQLFNTESSDQEKMLPRTVQIAAVITMIYAVFSVLCFLSYWVAGMSAFDALAHAMTTVSTAGFSTHDSSIGVFDSTQIELIAMVFMVSGALPFVIYMQVARGRFVPLWRDVQVRLFIAIVIGAIVLLMLQRILAAHDETSFWILLREVSFNVIAIATSTGYATEDFGAWGGFATALFFILLFMGGCTGSTAGGIKMFRVHVLAATLYTQLRKLTQPHGVFVAHYNNVQISDGVAQSVTTFLVIFVAGFFVLTAGLAAHDLDFITSASGAAAALGNIGPGLGPVIGPSGNYATLPDTAKLLLCIGMLMGRLEFFTILVLLTPNFWRE
ncbi:MAG: potassium transporter TrkH [Rhodospirillales bacterium]|nr:potassium transporter TrkH [Rhodospirillales bacterium]